MPPKVSCPGLDPAVGCQVPGSVPCSPPLVDSHFPESQLGSNQHWRRGRARFRQPESLCFAVCLLARLLHWLADLLLLARSACLACRRPLPLLRPVLTTFHLTTTTACTTTPHPPTGSTGHRVRTADSAIVNPRRRRQPSASPSTSPIATYLPYLPDLPTPTYRPTTFSRCPAPTLFGPTACLPACLLTYDFLNLRPCNLPFHHPSCCFPNNTPLSTCDRDRVHRPRTRPLSAAPSQQLHRASHPPHHPQSTLTALPTNSTRSKKRRLCSQDYTCHVPSLRPLQEGWVAESHALGRDTREKPACSLLPLPSSRSILPTTDTHFRGAIREECFESAN